MEAARQRVAALERELSLLVPGGSAAPIEVELAALRRALARLEGDLSEERRAREAAEHAAQELAVVEDRRRSLESSLELVQAELSRRRREHEDLFRRAALGDVRARETERLRAALVEASESAAREARRADVAEIALIRTQMRLAVERARSLVAEPFALDAPRTKGDVIRESYAIAALEALPRARLDARLGPLALLIADLVWNAASDRDDGLPRLFEHLRAAGHALLEHERLRFGPSARGAGLSLVLAPLALQLAWTRKSGHVRLVSISDEQPLGFASRRRGA